MQKLDVILKQTSGFPEDFQQLLLDLLEESNSLVGDELPDTIEVIKLSIEPYRYDVIDNLDTFQYRDWNVVNEFVDCLINNKNELPPAILMNGSLVDGYHRLTACFLVGLRTFPFIQLPLS